MFEVPWMSLLGGIIVGVSAITLMLFTGKTAGISGILNGAVESADRVWRIVFLIAMVLGGLFAVYVLGGHVPDQYSGSLILVIVAGLLVGVGTRIGNGCTSGHGICGIGRFSIRSVVATCTFMATAMLTVLLVS
ncbi:YeeE/YedE family protein [Vibrio alginolyticus]|uniref:YeeE/YedE family protein n=2 Tax=Vibrionaceae TaxID=641 RepID=A0A2L1XRH4_VIBAL|nr:MULTISPECIES: YeeE/YedE thiosulfate transporter family protein [Vibrio]MCC9649872.1 YeeE/YedE family protein [Vibrio sp. MA64]MCF7508938.1 YeeE/YedE family protein [Vibrio sp. D54]MDK9793639.1 YeeE/YedE family protein [Vibrio sp. D431a]MDK9801842.1 YeeE/YedE family protein [Vibrio sp. D406a]MDW2256922.1 YeeE/YedE thiosulfate transporter family protein [Vibrio sp. 1409]MDW2293248.1 YeeE/YedE thiosulfate transporter family protein [Vibrio sp. 1404]NNN39117.1 YeeE/YedE family protein [Vibrio